ncbi:MAG: GGDEF domain-containing protein, partial [Candidatus Thiodiazotropha sp. 6PDIVS]
FLTFNDTKMVKIGKIASVIVAFTLLDTTMKDYTPPYQIEESYLTAFRLLNVSIFLSSLVLISFFYVKITYSVRQQLEYASTTDQLTGLYNRRLFNHLAEIELSNLQRNNSVLTMIILDIDDFKKANDKYGHKCGDTALALVAETLHQTVRPKDIVSRWGGEEFIILLPNTDLENAALVAERVRLSISTQSVACQDFEFTLTVTLGLAVNNNYDESLDRLIERADRALYIGKANGKTNTSLLTRA